MSRHLRRMALPAVLSLLVLAYCLYSYWPVVHADWFVIDDHEVINRMGTADRLPLSRLPEAWRTQEISLSSTSTRYRLLYNPLLYLESIVYGKNVTLWFLERIAFAGLLGLALFTAARRSLGLYVGFAFTIFELSAPYWGPGMFTRLGSGETYGVLGLSLIAIAFCIDGHRMSSWRSSLLLALGLIVCVGTKENLLPFILLPVAVLVYARRELSIGSKVLLWASIAFTAWSGAVVAYRIKQASHDIYMREATLASRSHLLFDFFGLPSVRYWLVAIVLATGLWLYRRRTHLPADRSSSALGFAIAANVLSLGFYFSQFVFYNGDWPNADVPRYLFPGLLVRDFAAVFLAVSVLNALFFRHDSSTRSSWRTTTMVQNLATGILIVGLFVVAGTRFFDNRYRAMAMASDSSHFMRVIHDAVSALNAKPGAALLISAHSVSDFEPIVSISRFFRAFGGKGPIMLEVDEDAARKSSSFGGKADEALIEDLKKVETNGSRHIERLSRDRLGDCFSIGLSGPKSSSCSAGVSYDVPWEG